MESFNKLIYIYIGIGIEFNHQFDNEDNLFIHPSNNKQKDNRIIDSKHLVTIHNRIEIYDNFFSLKKKINSYHHSSVHNDS